MSTQSMHINTTRANVNPINAYKHDKS